MKGTLSQGLALPLSMFPEITEYIKLGFNNQLDDFAASLGVIRYDNEQQEYSQRPGLKSGKPEAHSHHLFLKQINQEFKT